jgi:hypothetical protein
MPLKIIDLIIFAGFIFIFGFGALCFSSADDVPANLFRIIKVWRTV